MAGKRLLALPYWGFKVEGLGFRVKVEGLGFRVLGFRVEGCDFRLRVEGLDVPEVRLLCCFTRGRASEEQHHLRSTG